MSDPTLSTYRLRLALVLLLAALLASVRLSAPPIWLDEASSWYNVSGTWLHLWQRAVQGEDTGGILFSALLKLWVGLAGTGEAALRAPGVVLLLGTIAALAHAVRTAVGRRAGVLAAAAALAHPSLLAAARQARGYILLLFLTSLAVLALAWRLSGRRRAAAWLLAGASLAAAATHVFGVFVAAGAAACHALLERQQGRPRAAATAACLAAPALAFAAAWAAIMHERVGRSLASFWIPGTAVSNYVGIAVLLVAPLAACCAWILWKDPSPRARSAAFGLGVMGIPIAAGPGLASLLASGSHNLVLLRYALALVPLTAAAAGCALATLPRRLALSVLTVALAGSLAYSVAKGAYAPVTRTGQDIRGAAAFLARDTADGDILFVEPANDWMPLAYYGVATAPVEGRDGRWRVVSENEERRTEYAGRRIWLVRFSRRTAAPPELLGRAVVGGRFGTITVLRVNQVR